MQNLASFSHLIEKWLRYKFQTILVIFFLVWTPFLVIGTLQIQHSCHPMIHWSNTLSAECQPKLQLDSSSSKKPAPSPVSTEQSGDNQSPKTPQPTDKSSPIEIVIDTAKQYPDITGGVIGIGIAGTVAAVATVPLAAAAGVGIAVWFVIRTVL